MHMIMSSLHTYHFRNFLKYSLDIVQRKQNKLYTSASTYRIRRSTYSDIYMRTAGLLNLAEGTFGGDIRLESACLERLNLMLSYEVWCWIGHKVELYLPSSFSNQGATFTSQPPQRQLYQSTDQRSKEQHLQFRC